MKGRKAPAKRLAFFFGEARHDAQPGHAHETAINETVLNETVPKDAVDYYFHSGNCNFRSGIIKLKAEGRLAIATWS